MQTTLCTDERATRPAPSFPALSGLRDGVSRESHTACGGGTNARKIVESKRGVPARRRAGEGPSARGMARLASLIGVEG